MTRIFGQNVSPEMLFLWLLETTACFVVLYALLAGMLADGALEMLPAGSAAAHRLAVADDALVLSLTVGLVGFALGLYRPETCLQTRRLLLQAGVAASASLPAVWLVASVAHISLAGLFGRNPLWPAEALIAWAALLLMTRLAYVAALRMDLFVRRVVVVGDGARARHTAEAIGSLRRGLFRVETAAAPGTRPDRPHLWGLRPWGLRPWGVILADGGAVPAALAGVRVLDAGAFWERQLGRIDLGLPHDAAAFAAPSQAAVAAAALRRSFDVALAALLLALTAPLMLATMLAIRLEGPGPLIYRQERVGLGGAPFTLMKFRSMRPDAERAGPAWAATRDPRVTRVGAFIRKVRIDELPQLFNILRGEMSLVGPRPERPHFVAQLADAIPLYRERARVKPGLTGWAQVNYPYGASVEDARMKLSYDLYYVKHRSLLLDVLILFATVRVILFQEGAR